jgi:hypothetical protein
MGDCQTWSEAGELEDVETLQRRVSSHVEACTACKRNLQLRDWESLHAGVKRREGRGAKRTLKRGQALVPRCGHCQRGYAWHSGGVYVIMVV